MTNPEDKKDAPTPAGNAPSWVDEVMGSSQGAPAQTFTPPAAPAVGATPPVGGTSGPAPQDLRIPGPEVRPPPQPQSQPQSAYAQDDDWVARSTGGGARNPSIPQGPAPTTQPTRSALDDLGSSAQQAVQSFGQAMSSGDVSQKKLIAGLLGIFLGSLGVHKFYLGMNNPGIIMLAGTIGGWILGIIGSFIIVGAIFFLVPFVMGILGLIEGIIYLTKSDADFQREYVVGKKPWL